MSAAAAAAGRRLICERGGMSLMLLRSSSNLSPAPTFAAGSSSPPLPFAAGGRSISGLQIKPVGSSCLLISNRRALRMGAASDLQTKRDPQTKARSFQIPSNGALPRSIVASSGPQIKAPGSVQLLLSNRRALHADASDPQTTKVRTLEAQGLPPMLAEGLVQVLFDTTNYKQEGTVPDRGTIARKLEAKGWPSNQAEAIAQVYYEILKEIDEQNKTKDKTQLKELSEQNHGNSSTSIEALMRTRKMLDAFYAFVGLWTLAFISLVVCSDQIINM